MHKTETCYKVNVSSKYFHYSRITEKTFYIKGESQKEVERYIEKYFNDRNRKILSMSCSEFTLLDLNADGEYAIGNIGNGHNGKVNKKPSLDMYDRR